MIDASIIYFKFNNLQGGAKHVNGRTLRKHLTSLGFFQQIIQWFEWIVKGLTPLKSSHKTVTKEQGIYL